MFGSRDFFVNQWRRIRLTGARRMSRVLAATLFPPRCCLCGFEGATPDLDLCAHCRADLPFMEPRFADPLVVFRYAPPVDDLIRRLKYGGAAAHARVLGVLLAQAVRARGLPMPRLLVPVPLHGARLRERGFNQSQALARYAGRLLEVPVARRAVVRVRDTPSQTSLDRAERLKNLRHAFAVNGPGPRRALVAAGHVAVVDDVVTTGSTVNELRRLLLHVGVERVDVWAVARAE